MATRKNSLRIVARPHKPLDPQTGSAQPINISPRWLLAAIFIALAGAVLCAWGTLCLLFWQGSWQLLYHPTAGAPRLPSGNGIPIEPVSFAATEIGQLRIQGWWIPGSKEPLSRFTILYLHGAKGNLGDCVEDLAALHATGANVLAFDYRGYGQSQFAHPSEARWTEDAGWALDYLLQTRHTDPRSIVLVGKELGADLATIVAAEHPELAGVVVRSPIEDPASVIFGDSRAGLVPARLLVKDRFDMDAAAEKLRIPSLWLLPPIAANAGEPSAVRKVQAQRQLVRVGDGQDGADAIARWLADLPSR
jgi:pimeloyl-ACP methyl ester carboxylesterase